MLGEVIGSVGAKHTLDLELPVKITVKIPTSGKTGQKWGTILNFYFLEPLLVFQLQLGFVFFHELRDVVGGAEEAVPLLVIESDGEAAEAIDADAAFFAYFEDEVAAAFLGLDFLFELGEFGFKFFV